jgi:hypothetical protein
LPAEDVTVDIHCVTKWSEIFDLLAPEIDAILPTLRVRFSWNRGSCEADPTIRPGHRGHANRIDKREIISRTVNGDRVIFEDQTTGVTLVCHRRQRWPTTRLARSTRNQPATRTARPHQSAPRRHTSRRRRRYLALQLRRQRRSHRRETPITTDS